MLLFKAVLASVMATMSLTGIGMNGLWSNHQNVGQQHVADATSSHSTTSSSDWYKGVYIQQVKQSSHLKSYVYPQIHGLRAKDVERSLNAYLKNLGTPKPTNAHDSISSSYTLLMQRGTLLELMMDFYDYSQGAAHGMPYQTAVMINLSDGTRYHVGDLFKAGDNYLTPLSNNIRKQDKQHILDSFQKFTGVTSHDGFYLSNGGVTVFFSPYEWTPYALGFPTYTVPFGALSTIINRTGSLWQTFHSTTALADARTEHQDLTKIRTLGYVPMTDPTDSFAQAGTKQHEYLYVFAARPKKVTDGSVQKLFFFLGKRYLGTDTWKDHGPVYDLTPTAEGTVSATYAGSVGRKDFTISFHWTGKKMKLTPAFPSNYSLWSNR